MHIKKMEESAYPIAVRHSCFGVESASANLPLSIMAKNSNSFLWASYIHTYIDTYIIYITERYIKRLFCLCGNLTLCLPKRLCAAAMCNKQVAMPSMFLKWNIRMTSYESYFAS